jgi:hypothetical protein
MGSRLMVGQLDGSNSELTYTITFNAPEIFNRTRRRKKSISKPNLLPACTPVIRFDTTQSTTEN